MTPPTKLLPALLTFLTAPLIAGAETTPLTQPLAEERETVIACEWAKTEPHQNVPVFGSAKESEQARGSYHYKLWLPRGYLADTARRWPCMFIADPGGNAGMGNMAARLQAGGYVVAMLVESKNGPWVPIVGNFLAAHDDLVQRVRIQEGLKFATGMSGGARGSSLFAQMRPGFAGWIGQGAGFAPDAHGGYHTAGLRKLPGFLVALTMGETDDNRNEIEKVRAAVPGAGRFLPLTFSGGHEWAPAEKFAAALDWMERQLYTEGPARAELKPAYTAYAQRLAETYAGQTAPWERLKAGDALLAYARARNLAMEPALAAQIREAQAAVQKLRADPALAREATAADAWKRLLEGERGANAAKLAADARDFAKRYAGTEAAREAEKRAGTPPVP